MTKFVQTVPPPPPLASSRRRGPRLQPPAALRVRWVSEEGPTIVALRDVGFRGFAIATTDPVTPKTRARVAFSTADSEDVLVADAVAVHCHLSLTEGNVWISGWEFPEQPDLEPEIDRLVEAVLEDFEI